MHHLAHRFLSISYIVLLLFVVSNTVLAASGEQIWHDYLAGGDPGEIRKQFAEALDENPNDAYAAAGIGFVEDSRCRPEEALGYWIRATENFAGDPVAELFLHWAYDSANEIAQWKELMDLCERLGESSSAFASLESRARFYRALAYRRQGKVRESLELMGSFDFITDYLACGPFDNAEKRGHDRTYGPEESFAPSENYDGRNRQVSWEPIPVRSEWGYVDLKSYVRPWSESTTYLAAVIESDRQARARLRVGHAGALKAWINGTPAINSNRYHGPFPDQVASQIELREGKNLLLLKVSSGEQGKYGIWARLEPLDGSEATWKVLPAGQSRVPDSVRSVAGSDFPAFDEEPLAVAAMMEKGPELDADSPHHLFFALLISRLDIVDEADHSEILTLTRLLEEYPESAVVRFYAARADRELNRQRRFLRGCLDRDPEFLRAHLALIDSFRSTPFLERRRRLIDEALEVAPEEARFVVQEARLMADDGLPDAAVGRARYAVELNPGIRETWWCLADFGSRIPRKEQRDIYDRLVRREASDLDAAERLARMAFADGDEKEALEWTETIREMDPWHFELYRVAAEYNLGEGEADAAYEAARQGLSVSPHDPGLHRVAAMALQQSGKSAEAAEHVNAVLAAVPSDPWALDYREHISPETSDYYAPYRRAMDTLPEPDPELIERANYVTLLHQDIKQVHPNGHSSQTVHDVIKVLTDTGLQSLQTRGIFYEPATDEVRILRARVWKKDGTFIDSPAPRHQSVADAGDAAAKLYGDYNVAVVAFPGLEKDAVIELEYQIEQKGENIYADYFGDIFMCGDYEPTMISEYVLITPVARDFYNTFIPPNYPPSVSTDRVVLNAQPEEQFEGRQRIQQWQFRNLPLIPREPYMPAHSEILPYLKVSTFQTWDDMTHWWWNLSKEQLIPGPTVKQKVREIVARYRNEEGLGPEDPIGELEKVRIVNSFVNTEVRYLGLEFGIHGYKPHRVDEICHAQYGDCKDKAALAVAMLDELGIEAWMVIIRTTQLGEIDYELPSLGLFNHCIYYLPDVEGKEYWIDGTAQFFDATELPPSDEGANTLIVRSDGSSFFKRVPTSSADENGGEYRTEITLADDGSAQGRRVADYRGLYNPIVRNMYENRAKAKDHIESQLVSRYPGGRCTSVEISKLEDFSTPEQLTYGFEIPNFGTPAGSRLSVPSVFYPNVMSLRYAQLSKREYDLVLPYRWFRTMDTKIALPEGWEVAEMPPAVEEDSPFGTYRWSASVVGGEIHITGEIQLGVLRVAPDEYQAFREFCQLIDNHEERRIHLRKAQ